MALFGPSSQLEQINNAIQAFSTQLTQEAGQEFGSANTVFNNLITPLQTIVNGGPSQMGMSQAEMNALNSGAVSRGAAMARDLAASAGTSASAYGGGNSPLTAGAGRQAVLDAQAKAAAETSGEINANTVKGYEQGRENFFNAAGTEGKLPSVFAASNEANKVAGTEQQTAENSQQEIDTQKGWWKPIVQGAISAGLGVATGGASLPITGAMGMGQQTTPGAGGGSNPFAGFASSPMGKLFGQGNQNQANNMEADNAGENTPAPIPNGFNPLSMNAFGSPE